MHSEFAYFKFPCAVWLGILFGLLHVSLHRELSYLTKTRYMEVDSLPVEPACFLLFSLSLSLFFLKLCLPFLLKQLGGGKKKTLLEFTSVILGALSLQIEKPSYKKY